MGRKQRVPSASRWTFDIADIFALRWLENNAAFETHRPIL